MEVRTKCFRSDSDSWAVLTDQTKPYSSLTGKMFKSLDLSLIVEFMLMFYKDKPIDWLLDHIMWVKVCNPEKDAVSIWQQSHEHQRKLSQSVCRKKHQNRTSADPVFLFRSCSVLLWRSAVTFWCDGLLWHSIVKFSWDVLRIYKDDVFVSLSETLWQTESQPEDSLQTVSLPTCRYTLLSGWKNTETQGNLCVCVCVREVIQQQIRLILLYPVVIFNSKAHLVHMNTFKLKYFISHDAVAT